MRDLDGASTAISFFATEQRSLAVVFPSIGFEASISPLERFS